jgi:hypothetical protein
MVHLALLGLELFSRHPVRDTALAARMLTRGPYRRRFWLGVVGAGHLAPIVLVLAAVVLDAALVAALAALLALAALWLWEDLWVKAGQSVPLS